MPNNTRIYWLHCLTPTHVGTGRGIGYIDLPLYREKITDWPSVPGSGFKGVWADYYQHKENHGKPFEERITLKTRGKHPLLKTAFGLADPDKEKGGANAGALIPTDARLVCLPVRSFMGTFAWCTSRLALQFLHRDLSQGGFTDLDEPPGSPSEGESFVVSGSVLKLDNRVYLEDLDFKAIENAGNVTAWANKIADWVFHGKEDWKREFVSRFVVLPDVVFDYLAEVGTEVVTRVRIDDETKTVAEGQLWTEESLPAESILAGVVACDRVYNGGTDEQTLLEKYAKDELKLQIGGKASVGRGQIRCVFTN